MAWVVFQALSCACRISLFSSWCANSTFLSSSEHFCSQFFSPRDAAINDLSERKQAEYNLSAVSGFVLFSVFYTVSIFLRAGLFFGFCSTSIPFSSSPTGRVRLNKELNVRSWTGLKRQAQAPSYSDSLRERGAGLDEINFRAQSTRCIERRGNIPCQFSSRSGTGDIAPTPSTTLVTLAITRIVSPSSKRKPDATPVILRVFSPKRVSDIWLT